MHIFMMPGYFLETIPLHAEQASYNFWLIILSYIVAAFASFTALGLGRELIDEARPKLRRVLHWAGAFVLGTGIWSMHFIGMLACQMKMKVEYDPWLTLISLLIAITVAYFVFGIISKHALSRRYIFLSAVLLGLGICGMHYIGMAAMRMDAYLRFIPSIFFLSVLIAIGASGAALWIVFRLARYSGQYRIWINTGAALIMGAAICGMHYTGMMAAVFIPYADCSNAVNQNHEMLTFIVTASTSLILGVAFALMLYRRISDNNKVSGDNFPLRLLGASCLLTISMGLGIIAIVVYSDFKLRDIVSVDDLLVNAGDELEYADDAQIYAVKMAVNNRNVGWEEAYNNTSNSIKDSLKLIEDNFPDAIVLNKINAVRAVNLDSYQIEKQIFASLHKQRPNEAGLLLLSPEYIAAQKNYANRVKELSQFLKQKMAVKLYSVSSSLHYVPYIIFVLSTLLSVAWAFALSSVLRWREELGAARIQLASSEREAREKQRFTDTIIDNIPLAIFAKNVKNGYRWEVWNRKAESLFELDAKDVLNKTDYDNFPKHEADFFRETDMNVMASRQVIDIPVEPVTTKRGTWMAHTIKVPIYDDEGEPSILLGILEDITETQAKDQALLDAHEKLTGEKVRLQTIMDSMMEGIITIDSKGVIQSFNIGAEKMFGYTTDEAAGQNVSILMPEPDKSAHDDYLKRYRETGEPRIIGKGRELLGIDKNGRIFPMTLSVKNMIIDGKLYFIGLTRDITEQKRKENELSLAKEFAEQASASKSDFLANMSHEIRTPMNGVLGMAGLLLDTDLTHEQRGWTEIIQKSGENLMEIINDILDFSKIEAGKLVLEPVAFELENAIMEVTDLLSLRTQEKGIELLVDMAPDLPKVIISDPVRFRQILMNLAGNAIKFTEKGHVLIRIKPILNHEGYIRLHVDVEDTGIGISPDKINHIFDKFSQAEESTTRRFGGTGLGLAICRKLADMMGGALYVASEPGVGSTFSFQIVVQEGEQDLSYSHIPSCDLAGLRALVIDDSSINCAILQQYLNNWHMLCEVATTADGAITMIKDKIERNEPYHFIFIDYRIDGSNGLQVADWIKSTPAKQDSILLMITASSQVATSSNLSDYGFDAFFSKPFYPEHIKSALQLLRDARLKGNKLPLVTRYSISQMLRNDQKSMQVTTDIFAGTRVLVVEDMKVNRMLITTLLEKHGCKVFSAENGKQAIGMIAHNDYDLIFMDCQMPEMDGFEATKRIRAMEGNKRYTTIIALTADAMVGDREKCLHAGMDDYLNKPLHASKVTEMLQKWAHKEI